jgi:hypothetical protein
MSDRMFGVTDNRRSGHKKPWQAKISVDNRDVTLGMFATPEEASIAYNAARKVHPPAHRYYERISDGKRQAIRDTYHYVHSTRKAAQPHGVHRRTVQRILREAQ